MDGAAKTATGEKLSREEIWRRHPNEWVVLVDTDRSNMVTTAGVVYGHSPIRDEARGLRACAIFWTGRIRSPTTRSGPMFTARF